MACSENLAVIPDLMVGENHHSFIDEARLDPGRREPTCKNLVLLQERRHPLGDIDDEKQGPFARSNRVRDRVPEDVALLLVFTSQIPNLPAPGGDAGITE